MLHYKLAADTESPRRATGRQRTSLKPPKTCDSGAGFFNLRAWWNWQTRKSQELVALIGRVSSSLTARTRKKGGTRMSDLFYTGRASRTSGSLTVSCRGGSDIVKKLQKLEHGGEVAIKRTVADFTSRAPGWVSKEIRQHYGVDTAAIKDAAKKPKRGRTSIKVAGVTVDGATLEYKGRTLTVTHFKMSPKQQPTARQKNPIRIPGQAVATARNSPVAMVAPPKPYTVKATIIKGQRTALGAGSFIASGNGGSVLPFQRTAEGRKPIEAVRTLSVPQMIDGRAREGIQEAISTGLEKRFAHHIEQAMR